jgi:hypothetical protein
MKLSAGNLIENREFKFIYLLMLRYGMNFIKELKSDNIPSFVIHSASGGPFVIPEGGIRETTKI